jgi:hypothetical protein
MTNFLISFVKLYVDNITSLLMVSIVYLIFIETFEEIENGDGNDLKIMVQ